MTLLPMADRTAEFDELLKQHGAPKTRGSITADQIDEYTKEAYRIYHRIASLLKYLRSIRQAYLSTAQPPRTARRDPKALFLTDYDRDQVDAKTGRLIRELRSTIQEHERAQTLFQGTQQALIRKQYGSPLTALGKWAPSGSIVKSPEQQAAEERLEAQSLHRHDILWFLEHWLRQPVEIWTDMKKTRVMRQMEKDRSVLARTKMRERSDAFQKLALGENGSSGGGQGISAVQLEEEQKDLDERLTPEKLQMFEKANQDMLKLHESKLDKINQAQKSLIEIAELHDALIGNLGIQAEHIEQLVSDEMSTQENVGKANEELKRAQGRFSFARFTFYVSVAVCSFVVVADLVLY